GIELSIRPEQTPLECMPSFRREVTNARLTSFGRVLIPLRRGGYIRRVARLGAFICVVAFVLSPSISARPAQFGGSPSHTVSLHGTFVLLHVDRTPHPSMSVPAIETGQQVFRLHLPATESMKFRPGQRIVV